MIHNGKRSLYFLQIGLFYGHLLLLSYMYITVIDMHCRSGQSDVESVRISSNNWSDLLARPGLLATDVLALLLFALIGRSSHNEGFDLSNLLLTAAPFLLAWLALGPLLGAYSRTSTAKLSSIPLRLMAPWAVSIPAALAIRGLVRQAVPPTPFIIVSLVSTLLLLSLSRAVYISLVGETSDEEYRQAGSLEIFKMIGSLMKRW